MGSGQEYRPVEPAEFKKYLAQRFDHHGPSRFWLEGAHQYLKVQESLGHPWNQGSVRKVRASALETSDRDMKAFALAEEFAQINELDLDGTAFLAKVKTDLEDQYGLCPHQLEYSLNYFVQNGSSPFNEKLDYCHRLADAIDLYFGEYRRADLGAFEARAAALGI